jgi:hypothetical protein
VVTVAMHRLPPAVKIPGELLKFCPDEWVAPVMGRLGLLRFGVGRLPAMRGWKRILIRSLATCSRCFAVKCR